MVGRRNSISASERERRTRKRAQSLAAVDQLLYSRRQTAHALGGISIATVIRLENRGLLTKVRLAGVPSGAVFHRAEQVRALAEGGNGGAARARQGAAAGDAAELNRQ